MKGLLHGRKREGYEEHFVENCLKAHNKKRELHKSPPLKLNKKLSEHSHEWAKHLAKLDTLQHRPESKYGENIFKIFHEGHVVTAEECVDHWYSEIEKHTFHEEPAAMGTGHFTQVIWYKSQELGVGVARADSGAIYVVCNYDPPGNYVGNYSENVPPIGGFSDVDLARLGLNKLGMGHNPIKEQTSAEFAEDCLRAHNIFRRDHGVPELTMNKEICKFAEEWAKTLASKEKLENRETGGYGENVNMIYNPAHYTTGAEVAEHWYQQGKDYDYDKEPEGSLKSGNFTQMMWKGTEQFGVGKAKSSSGKLYIVANYYPPGNYRNEFLKNVLRPLGK